MTLHQGSFKGLGFNSAGIIGQTEAYSVKNYSRYPFAVKSAYKAHLKDADGNFALDLLGGFGTILSHAWNVPIMALSRLMRDTDRIMDLVSNAVYSVPYGEFCEMVTRFTGFDVAFPKSNGGSVTESAISAMFMHAYARGLKDPYVILFRHYFHGRGRTFQTNATFDECQYVGKGPQIPGIRVIPRTMEAFEAALDGNAAGVMLEIHQGEAGPIFDNGFYQRMFRRAREKGLFIVVDEVQTGFYRCGHRFAWTSYGMRPDGMTIGKAMTGGLVPNAALVGTREFMSVFKPGTDGETFSGNPFSCVPSVAVMKYLEKYPLYGRAVDIGTRFARNLAGIPNVTVNYRGAMVDVLLNGVDGRTATAMCHDMILGRYGPRIFVKSGHTYKVDGVPQTHLRISPPTLAITDEMIDEGCERTLRPALEEIVAK